MPTDKSAHTGACLCGGVSFSINGKLRDGIACHCNQCRRTSGFYVVASACKKDQLSFEAKGSLAWYRSSEMARRGFCNRCGSSLFWAQQGSHQISIMTGALDLPTGIKVSHHIFVADAADYYRLTDGLPQHDQYEEDKEAGLST